MNRQSQDLFSAHCPENKALHVRPVLPDGDVPVAPGSDIQFVLTPDPDFHIYECTRNMIAIPEAVGLTSYTAKWDFQVERP